MTWFDLHSKWIELGGAPERFWDMSPCEIDREAKAMAAGLKRKQEFEILLTWNTAILHRCDYKKFPKFPEFLERFTGTKAKQQSVDEMISIARRWHNATGVKRGN